MERRIVENEQYTYASILKIQGIPDEGNDIPVYNIVTKVKVALVMDFSKEIIYVCLCLKKKEDSEGLHREF